MVMNGERDPLRVPEAERYGCGKRRFGLQVAHRGGLLLLAALLVIAVGIVLAVAS
jgi:hypothetical protein